MIVDYLSSKFDRVVANVKDAKPILKAILYKGPKIKRSQVIRPHVKGYMLKSPTLDFKGPKKIFCPYSKNEIDGI